MTSQAPTQRPAVEPTTPVFTSSSHLGLGFFFALLGGVLFIVVTAGGDTGSGGMVILVLAALLVVAAHILFAIGIIAKGVKLGIREAR